jgi:hypothetical protein
MTIPRFYPLLLAAAAAALAGCAGTQSPVSPRIDLLGMPAIDEASVQPGERTMAITPATRWLNVDKGDIVHFTAGSQHFAWNFQASPNIAMFDLNQVAPAGALPRRVPVYLAPNPVYSSGP